MYVCTYKYAHKYVHGNMHAYLSNIYMWLRCIRETNRILRICFQIFNVNPLF